MPCRQYAGTLITPVTIPYSPGLMGLCLLSCRFYVKKIHLLGEYLEEVTKP